MAQTTARPRSRARVTLVQPLRAQFRVTGEAGDRRAVTAPARSDASRVFASCGPVADAAAFTAQLESVDRMTTGARQSAMNTGARTGAMTGDAAGGSTRGEGG
jgi:hypothetical protein